MKTTEVTAGLAESNGSLLPGLWRDSLHVTCGLTACTPGSAPGPTLGNEYGKTLPFYPSSARDIRIVSTQRTAEVLETSQDGDPWTGVIKSYNSHGRISDFTHSQQEAPTHRAYSPSQTVRYPPPAGYFSLVRGSKYCNHRDCVYVYSNCLSMRSYFKNQGPDLHYVLFYSLAVLDPRIGHTMDLLSPFIAVLCHSD